MKQREVLGMKGHVRIVVDRANGKREVQEMDNTISTELKEAINNNLFASNDDIRLDAPFIANATPPGANLDGIVIMSDGSNWYSMICTMTEPTATTTKISGTLTGVADTFTECSLGFKHAGTDTENFDVSFAEVASFDNVILAAADTLTVEWTIDCAP